MQQQGSSPPCLLLHEGGPTITDAAEPAGRAGGRKVHATGGAGEVAAAVPGPACVVHRAICRRLHQRTLLPKHRWHVNPRGGEHSSSAALLRRRRFDLIITCIGKS